MNKKIAKTLLILCISYMVGYYILKFIFPEQLLLVVTDANIIRLGKFVQSNIIIENIFRILTSFITYYLFSCACTGRFKFKWYEFLIILAFAIISRLCAIYLTNLYTHTAISIMLLLPTILKGKLLYTSISFILHGYLTQFLLEIRGFETIITQYNLVSGIVLMIEGFVWLIILTILFNLKEKKDGFTTTIHKQNGTES